jgi:integrase
MLLLLYTGLRKMEAARLKWADIDFKARTFSSTPEKKRGEKPEDDRVTMLLSIGCYSIESPKDGKTPTFSPANTLPRICRIRTTTSVTSYMPAA